MATKFLEPGGDATFNVAATTNKGFWATIGGTPTIETSPVHGAHVRSIKYAAATNTYVQTAGGSVADAGSRISFYIYIVTLPSASQNFLIVGNGIGQTIVKVVITTGGVLQLFEQTNQIGINGTHTLVTGQWYRISLAYTVTSTIVNRFELFVDAASDISVTNATLTRTGSSIIILGNQGISQGLVFHSSDHYIDDSNALTDPGNIWVTAKRPFSNGTSNNFATQIGADSSDYGTGHAPEVNERPLSTTNGWGGVSSQTEEYTIEAASVGDIGISGLTIVDFVGWVYFTRAGGNTATFILAGATSSFTIPDPVAMITKVAGSTTYPAGNTDIGVTTPAAIPGAFNLFECGIMIAFIGPPILPLDIGDSLMTAGLKIIG